MSAHFEIEERGYRIVAEPSEDGESIVEVSKDGEVLQSFRWPSYKIWNVAAHARDIIDGLEQDSDSGLREAGSDGLGGNVYLARASADHEEE